MYALPIVKPIMASAIPPPLRATSTAAELACHLQAMQAECEKQGNNIYIHPRVMSFSSEKEKVNWMDCMPEIDRLDRGVFSNFTHTGKENKQYWLGLFPTPIYAWVNGKKDSNQWDDEAWHCWAVAVVPGMDSMLGRHIFVYDCDPKIPERRIFEDAKDQREEDRRLGRMSANMLNKQCTMVKMIRNECGVDAQIWVNQDESRSDRGQCVRNSIDWMWKMIRAGGDPIGSGDDERLRGFKHVNP